MRAVRAKRARAVVAAFAVAALAGVLVVVLVPGKQRGGTLERPIDRGQLTAFGTRSHWLQPWRAYLDTRPAQALRDAVGINFNVDPAEADAAARLLAANGFKRARVEINWGNLSYSNPSSFRDAGPLTLLRALKRHGIRPLILLNAYSGGPCPREQWRAVLTQPAPAGATSVKLDAASARRVRAGRSGLDAPDGSKAAAVLFTKVAADGTATLSKPLPAAVGAGPQPASTLLYAPFGAPQLPDGRPNPAFEQTLKGWLDYVRVVTGRARAIFGSSFDVEVWNELSFGSDFLYADRYYANPPAGTGDPTKALLERTVRWIRDPASGVPSSVGIGDGFTNQSPFDSGATVPPGTTAIDKHPYKDRVTFPKGAVVDQNQPLDALGRPDGIKSGAKWRDRFVPSYSAYMPEYYLTAIQTETLVRDLAPFTTKVYGTTPHGRRTHPPGSPPPAMWITETGLDATQASRRLSPADLQRLHAKATLRALVAYVNKGVSAIDFFAAKDPNWGLIDPAFFDRAAGGAYPGDASGGQTLTAVRRLTEAMQGPAGFSRTRPLTLQRISDNHDHQQFAGDGSAAHPPLYDRNVVAFFPFQTSPTRYVIPTYVMTRDAANDLAPESFAITFAGLPPGSLHVSASDPITGERVSAKVTAHSAASTTVELPLTDYPRLLTIDVR